MVVESLKLWISGSDIPRPSSAHHEPAGAGGTATDTTQRIRQLLRNQMIRAKRAGTWWRLPGRERGLYSLALRLDVKLQSHELLKALVSVLKSLRETCDRGYMALMRAMKVAWAFSEFAVKAGNAGAKEWRNDRLYIEFLKLGLE